MTSWLSSAAAFPYKTSVSLATPLKLTQVPTVSLSMSLIGCSSPGSAKIIDPPLLLLHGNALESYHDTNEFKLVKLKMPRIVPQYPAAGESAIADAVRARRGARGLTVLDGALLNAPEMAVSALRNYETVRAHSESQTIRVDGIHCSGRCAHGIQYLEIYVN